MSEHSFVLQNSLSEIEHAHEIVTRFGDEYGLHPDTVFELDLVLEEIITNIIRYGYDDRLQHDIHLRFRFEPGNVTIEVEDDARPFNPLEVPAPDIDRPLEERPIGGLGIFLVRKMTDHQEYRREEGRNILTVKKRL